MPSAGISGVVLAAGPSTRFGDRPPKQLLPVEGQPLVRLIAARALRSSLSEVLVVVGKAATEVKAACRDLEVVFVDNPQFAGGQSGSVRLGLAAVDSESAAAMFIPADQPGLTTAVIDSIADSYRHTGGRIVVPTCQGRRGAPVLFDRSLFGELSQIEGDAGGRQLFGLYESEIVEVPLTSSLPLEDLDTPDDLQELLG